MLCVLQQLVWHRTQNPLGKTHHPNVSQTRLSLDSAEGLCESSGALFDEEMARLPAPFLGLPWGCSAAYFLLLVR